MRENDPDDRQLSGGRADHYRPTTADRGVLRDFPDRPYSIRIGDREGFERRGLRVLPAAEDWFTATIF